MSDRRLVVLVGCSESALLNSGLNSELTKHLTGVELEIFQFIAPQTEI
jgi:hypothetical protein